MFEANSIALYKKAWENFDWSKFIDLANSEPAALKGNSDIALMIAGAAFFLDSKKKSEQLLRRASKLSKKEKIQRFVLSVCQAQLGRAAVLANQPQKGLCYFQSASVTGGELIQPLFYDFLFQEAESQLHQGNAQAAIQTWQDLASLLQDFTPEIVYHRMSHCYSVNQKGFGGNHEENYITGDCHKHDLLEFFHLHLQPDFYFEIGVDEGFSLARAKGKALGVDARSELNLQVDLPDQAKIISTSSDAFFREQAANFFTTPPDLAFIDGMHLFEFALRDFINIEHYAAPYALVCIDDIFPCHPIQAERRRRSSAWTGDVWKLLSVLQKYRPDLTLMTLPCSTTGLLLIAGLDAKNTQLQEHYHEILQEYQADLLVPDRILQRCDCISSDHPVVSLLLNVLKRARGQQADTEQVRTQLAQLTPFIEEAKLQQDLPTHPKTLEQLHQEHVLASTQTYLLQLFLPQQQAPVYSEASSLKLSLPAVGWQEAVFSFHQALPQHPLRFDPSTKPGLFEIKSVHLLDKRTGEFFLELTNKEQLKKLKVQGNCQVLVHPKKFLLHVYALDPVLILPIVQTPETDLELHVNIRQVTDLGELREFWGKCLE